MEIRKPISKKMRFDTFKRDCFKCQYCGKTPPSVVLEVDHVFPVSKGGKNTINNLITACFDCNRGKGAELLSAIPDSLEARAEILKEKREQIRAYNKLTAAIEADQMKAVEKVEAVFQRYFPTRAFSDSFRDSIRVNFVPRMAEDQIVLAITKACIKQPSDSSAATKYFCGVCWGMIKGTYGTR